MLKSQMLKLLSITILATTAALTEVETKIPNNNKIVNILYIYILQSKNIRH